MALLEVSSTPNGLKVHHAVAEKTNSSNPFLDMSRHLLTSRGMRKHLSQQRSLIGKPKGLREWAIEETVPETKVEFSHNAIGIVWFVMV